MHIIHFYVSKFFVQHVDIHLLCCSSLCVIDYILYHFNTRHFVLTIAIVHTCKSFLKLYFIKRSTIQ